MNIIGVIPARYQSTRFPGKPLGDILGKPMIWWVYQRVKAVKELDEVYAAVDNIILADACKKFDIPFIMTENNHPNHISRIYEVSKKIPADFYVCVNGDEPLIDSKSISVVINYAKKDKAYFTGAFRYLSDGAETIDIGNIKIVTNENNEALYISRNPIPFPKSSLMFKYKKYVGIECFTKEALSFFVNTKMGNLEQIEDIDHLRFIENKKTIKFIEVKSDSISVDTPKDLEKVRILMGGGEE